MPKNDICIRWWVYDYMVGISKLKQATWYPKRVIKTERRHQPKDALSSRHDVFTPPVGIRNECED